MRNQATEMPSAELLKSILDYDATSGVLTWKVNKQGQTKKGMIAGGRHSRGYISIGINGKLYLAHRIIWFMCYGVDPKDNQIDHINLNRSDNRIANLRIADSIQNRTNTKVRKHSKSGIKGIRKYKDTNRWQARISINKKEHVIGYFDTPEEAHAAFCKKSEEVRGQFHNSGD